jgi:ankyrin repeat protein
MTDSQLVLAARDGNLALVRQRLEEGDGIEEKIGNDTALLAASRNGHTEVVRLLVEWGADLSASTSGYTGWGLAKYYKHEATVAFLASAVQQPRKPPPSPERWISAGPATVAFVGTYPALEQKLTYIFNFEMRERLVTSHNLRTGADTVLPPVSFDALAEQTVEKALGEFTRLGGVADRDYVLRGTGNIGKSRKPPNLEPSS